MQDYLVFMQQHWALSSALIIVLLLLILLEFVRQKRGGARLSPTNATHLMNHENAVVIDVRNADQFAAGHIIGAVSIPLAEIEKTKKIDKFKSQPIILVCATGTDSPRAAALLDKQGYKVHILNGGVRAWREADMPIVKG